MCGRSPVVQTSPMTAVVGLLHAGSVYIGGDSAGRRVLSALGAAERFSAGVRGPFVCLKISGKR